MSTSRSLNKVMLIGNITRDPALRETPNGGLVSTFGIATNASWKDADGNVQERTEFHNVVAWNKLAEITAQILSTGMLVYIEGELRTRTWEDTNAIRHYRTEIKIDDLKLLDKKGREPIGIDKAKDASSENNTSSETVKEEKKSVDVVKSEDHEEISKEAEELF